MITLHENESQALIESYSDINSMIALASLIDGIVSIASKSHPASIKHSSLGRCHFLKSLIYLL
jgi:hypothetical protein